MIAPEVFQRSMPKVKKRKTKKSLPKKETISLNKLFKTK